MLGAYLRSMRDPFPHARVAALKAAAFSLALEDGRYWPLDLLSKKVRLMVVLSPPLSHTHTHTHTYTHLRCCCFCC